MKTKNNINQNWILKLCSIVIIILFSNIHSNAQLEDRITINGYSSFEFEYQLTEEGESDPNGSFDADLFDIVTNIDVSSNLRFVADITWEHGAASEDGRGNVALEYAFPEYTVKEWLKFRVGKMFIPFGIYNEIHTAKPAFLAVKEPLSTNKPHKFGADERFYPRWGTGFSVLGNFKLSNTLIDYHIQVTNGEQENTNPFEEDDNIQKAIASRIRVMPSPNFKIGVSMYTDKLTELDSLDEVTANRSSLFSLSGHVEYTINNLGFEFEYIRGSIDPSYSRKIEFPADSRKITKQAMELMVYYTIKDSFTPYVRYEFLNADIDLAENEASMISFGLNTLIDENFFLKLQYNSISSGAMNEEFAGVNYSEFQSSIVLGF